MIRENIELLFRAKRRELFVYPGFRKNTKEGMVPEKVTAEESLV